MSIPISFVCTDNGQAIGVSVRVESFVLHPDGRLETRQWFSEPDADGVYSITVNNYYNVLTLSVGRDKPAEETLQETIRRRARTVRAYILDRDGNREYYSQR